MRRRASLCQNLRRCGCRFTLSTLNSWFPHCGKPELLRPSYAARVRKDLLNIILADLIIEDGSQEALDAKLEALSDTFDAYQKAAEQEREGLGEKMATWA